MATDALTPGSPGGLAATTFFSRTYDEALALLVEAREYNSVTKANRVDPLAIGLVHSLEIMRLTARLTHIMAWLLVQRAVHAGEITREQARDEPFRLDGHGVCLDVGAEKSVAMPARLRGLLKRSRKLYQRIARLDQMVRRDRA